MKGELKSTKHIGLTLGIVSALFHAVWVLLVGLGVGQTLIDIILPLHFIDVIVGIGNFNILSALWLVVLAFVGGFIVGWLIGEVWNFVVKKVK